MVLLEAALALAPDDEEPEALVEEGFEDFSSSINFEASLFVLTPEGSMSGRFCEVARVERKESCLVVGGSVPVVHEEGEVRWDWDSFWGWLADWDWDWVGGLEEEEEEDIFDFLGRKKRCGEGVNGGGWGESG